MQSHHGASQWQQLGAVLRKNFILQTRGRRSLFGLGGWAALLLQVCLPAAFFLLIWIPRYYIKPVPHAESMPPASVDIESRWWSGPIPYSGPAVDQGRDGQAHVLLAPAAGVTAAQVSMLATVLAKALACPRDQAMRACPAPQLPNNFHCMFIGGVADAPQCQDPVECHADPSCYSHLLSRSNLRVMASEEEAVAAAMSQPNQIDAIVVLSTAPSLTESGYQHLHQHQLQHQHQQHHGQQYQQQEPESNSPTDSADHSATGRGCGSWSYTIRMNHTDVPPTPLLLDLFDVSPTRTNGLGLYRDYWFFTNLQFALDRAILGLQVAHSLGSGPAAPPDALSTHSTHGLHSGNTTTQSRRHSNATGPASDAAWLSDGGGDPLLLQLSVRPFPWPAALEDLGAASAAAFMNLLLVFSFLAPTRGMVLAVVSERELRLREGMKLLGLGDSAYWLSWAATHWSTLLASGLLCTAMCAYPFPHTSLPLLAAFFALLAAALVPFSYLLSTLFPTARVAGTATQFLYALAVLPGFIGPTIAPYGGAAWWWACLLPPSAASMFAGALINWELVSKGLNTDTFALPVSQESGFSAASVFFMLAVDVLLYSGLVWYLDKVMGSADVPGLPLWFPFLPSYWRDKDPPRSTTSIELPVEGPTIRDSVSHSAPAGPEFAVSTRGLTKVYSSGGGGRLALDAVDLDFRAGRVTAVLGHNGAGKSTLFSILTGSLRPTAGSAWVAGLDIASHMADIRHSLGVCPQFDLLWPDLTVLEHLQLYSCIKGMQQQPPAPAAGPSQPGAPQSSSDAYLHAAAAEVGLGSQLHSLASQLSGGQRRKLSVALSLLGSPTVVFLDEPTSGMDPFTRRFTWDLIRSRRARSSTAAGLSSLSDPLLSAGETATGHSVPLLGPAPAIILTTHSMEEAEALADDVVVLAEGRVAAAGTPLQLRHMYATGYTMVIALAAPPSAAASSNGAAKEEQALSAAATQAAGTVSAPDGPVAARWSTLQALIALVRRHISDASLLPPSAASALTAPASATSPQQATPDGVHAASSAEDGFAASLTIAAARAGSPWEASFRLPGSSTAQFPTLLRALDAAKPQLGVTGYSLSETTLEEVFHTITTAAHQQGQQAEALEADRSKQTPLAPSKSPGLATGQNGQAQQQQQQQQQGWRAHHQAPPVLHGWRLHWQQFRALLVKRGLIASRDRLALLTQLLVPLLLVYLALWVQGLAVEPPTQAPLLLSRATALRGTPTAVAAPSGVRTGAFWDAFLAGYSQPPWGTQPVNGDRWGTDFSSTDKDSGSLLRGVGVSASSRLGDSQMSVSDLSGYSTGSAPSAVVDSGAEALWRPGLPRAGSLEGWLLQQWHSGRPVYDALFVASGPNTAVPVAQEAALLGVQLVLSVNQSAVHALPASISQATTALLRYLVNLPPIPSPPPFPPPSPAPPLAPPPSVPWMPEQPPLPLPPDAQPAQAGSAAWTAQQGNSMALDVAPSACNDPAIQVTSSPLPPLPTEPLVRVQQAAASLMLALCLTLAASVLTASFAVQLVRERSSGFLLVQTLSGTPPWLSWAAGFTWDLAQYAVPCCGIIVLMAWYHLPQYSGLRLAAVAALLAALGAAGLPATNLLQRFFRDDMAALQRLNTLYFTVGYCGYLATWILDLVVMLLHPPKLEQAVRTAKGLLFTLSPHYCFVSGAAAVATTAPSSGATPPLPPPFGPGAQREAFDWEVSGRPLAYLLGQCAAYTTLALLLDSGLPEKVWAAMCHLLSAVWSSRARGFNLQRLGGGGDEEQGLSTALLPQQRHGPSGADEEVVEDEDADVLAERDAVLRGQRDDSPLLLKALKKTYWPMGPLAAPVRAVKGVSVGVLPGECFGLLGVNGAGKTTTFRLITGEQMPDAWQGGDALVAGTSVVMARLKAQRQLGYCPQFDGLPVALTGAELLCLYSRLRGVPWHVAPGTAEALLARVGLPLRDWHRPTGTYSGGNRRKLAVTVAMVGEPQVVLLDEPSTGMDPGARRQLWALIATQVLPSTASHPAVDTQSDSMGTALLAAPVDVPTQATRSVVLSSHSMAECEALCSRVGILSAGRLQCLGTPQQLIGRFDSGYVLTVRLMEVGRASATSAGSQACQHGNHLSDYRGSARRPALPAAMQEMVLKLQHACEAVRVLEADWPQLVLGVPKAQANMAALFEVLEGCRWQEGLGGVGVGHQAESSSGGSCNPVVAAYSLTPAASLERVFVSIASRQP